MRSLALTAAVAIAAAAALPPPAAACPPGLAKKDPPCVPPGLAKKGVTAEEWARGRDDGDDDYDRWEDTPTRAERYDDLLRDYGDLMSDVALVVLEDGTVLRPGDRLPGGYRPLARADYPYLPPLPPDRRYYRVGDRVAEVIEATDTLVRTWKLLTD